ncbi:F-box domain [Arabidopsis suecica]|uniref:F-box domain n=1 Tax=Arabidopsis suecica TaxID=45249 RepID=A0A8T1Y088_ARASU|nr:F-box domain [Arabidopsis suecica]
MEKQRLRLSDLPDELLLKILSSLPMFKETLATRLISKRWKGPWKLVPDVMFDDDDTPFKSFETFMSFVYGSFLSNDAQILDRLHLKLNQNYSASDINFWVQVAVNRSVRELRIDLFGKTLELPCCLCSCRTLKELTLHELRIKVVPPWFRLPSLKTLHLLSVKFSSDGSVASLLRICPVLERLVVDRCKYDKLKISNINVPNLRSLSIRSTGEVRIELFGNTLELSTCLSTFRNLTELILHGLSIKAFPPWFRFSSLKTLRLSSVKFLGNKSVASLFKICPVLECLVVDQTKDDNVMISNIDVPTLRSLTIRSARELRIDLFLNTFRNLKELILHELRIKVVPPSFSLPSLEALHLLSVKFLGDESVASLLKICPVLEHLVVDQIKNDNVMISNIDVPTLRNLSIRNSKGKRTYVEGSNGFVIKAPSLTELNFEDTLSNFTMFEPMPEVIKANIQVICDQSENFIGSLTAIQHLSLCSLTSKTPYPACTVFSSLKHLELCTCSAGWANLLTCLLNAAPGLRSLKLKSKHSANYNDPMTLWEEPAVVPKCLSEHLEILEWRQYEGTEQERNVAEYTLANATCLKMATFSTRCRNKNHRMLKKLKSMDRVSKTCQLVFD